MIVIREDRVYYVTFRYEGHVYAFNVAHARVPELFGLLRERVPDNESPITDEVRRIVENGLALLIGLAS